MELVMPSHYDSFSLSYLDSHDPSHFDIWGGTPALAKGLVSLLANQGFKHDPSSPIKFLLDIPQGIAFRVLELMSPQEDAEQLIIIVTFNPCVEYWEDLWDLRPNVLLVNPKNDRHLMDAINRASDGERYRTNADCSTPLNRTERQILRLVAHTQSNKQIAHYLKVQEKTVSNALTEIYNKLHLKDRQEAILYYWGIRYVLNNVNSVKSISNVLGASDAREVQSNLQSIPVSRNGSG
jgi:DNA-binding CsgD family transcriptional regulator